MAQFQSNNEDLTMRAAAYESDCQAARRQYAMVAGPKDEERQW